MVAISELPTIYARGCSSDEVAENVLGATKDDEQGHGRRRERRLRHQAPLLLVVPGVELGLTLPLLPASSTLASVYIAVFSSLHRPSASLIVCPPRLIARYDRL